MKIEDRRIDNMFVFDDLDIGDVFEFYGKVYMKVADKDLNRKAIKLMSGIVCTFDSSKNVRKLNAKLVIEDEEVEVTEE